MVAESEFWSTCDITWKQFDWLKNSTLESLVSFALFLYAFSFSVSYDCFFNKVLPTSLSLMLLQGFFGVLTLQSAPRLYKPYLTTAYYCLLLPTIAYYYLLLPTTSENCLPLPTTAFYCLLLPTTAYYYLLLPATAYYFWKLPTTAYCLLLPYTAYYCLLLLTTTDLLQSWSAQSEYEKHCTLG